MSGVNPEAFEFALSKITDGFVFERFAQDLLCQIIGVEFVPVGRVHDRAIDGLEHCSGLKLDGKTIYQISIEASPKTKIERTLTSLKDNKIACERFFYVTNRIVDSQDLLEEECYAKYGVVTRCRDAAWLRGNVNKTEGAVRTYLTFIDSHVHEFTKPGTDVIVTDFARDPRIFVFLRQQLHHYGHHARLDELLTDSLALLALEGTDPERGLFMDRGEILAKVDKMVSFSHKNVEAQIGNRLEVLSTKPRRINYYRETKKYCLPYATRLELEEQTLADSAVYEKFLETAQDRIKRHLAEQSIHVKDVLALLEKTLNNIFKQQGLEFADFIIKAENRDAVERSLPDAISEVVDASSVIPVNRSRVKAALLSSIREMIYSGSPEELEYMRCLANSYMMLFLIQCDPQIGAYFATMASKLTVFVCTSLLVPALSEMPLPPEHRRHYNLLLNANAAGVTLLINGVILRELVGHIRKARNIYQDDYQGREAVFGTEEAVPYIREILLRSYFYSLTNGVKWSFDSFLDKFVSPNGSAEEMEEELISWLQATFGIKYRTTEDLGVTVAPEDLRKLAEELSHHKPSEQQARNDAQTILSVFALRDKNGEKGEAGVFGYRTWWLSKDFTTQRAVTKCFGTRYPTSCYIRPDFLLNYIALAPSSGQANQVFDKMFPTLMGVTLSRHVPQELSNLVHDEIKEHSDKGAARVGAVLRSLADRLKTDTTNHNRVGLKHFLDEEFRK